MDHEAHTGDPDHDGDGDGDGDGGRRRDEVLLDVRPLIERGEEPFGTIMETVASLDGRSLLLVAPFEPTPLQGVLGAQGFTYSSECVSETEWRVRFEPAEEANGAPGTADTSADTSADAPPAPVPAAESSDTDTPDTDTPDTHTPDTDTPDTHTPDTDTDTPDAVSQADAAPAAESPYTIKRAVSSAATTAQGAQPRPDTGALSESGGPTAPAVVPPTAMAMNPTLNVPPAWLPLGFMAAAGVGLVGFGVAVMITAPSVVSVPRHDHVIAAVHLGVLAFLSTAVLGALHQFGPVVGGKPLRSIPAGAVTGAIFVPGAWLIPIGFATGHVVVIQVGGVLATTAVCVAAWNLSRPLSATGKGAPIVGLRMAVTYLVVTAAFGIVYAFDRGTFWFELLSNRVLAHAHIGLIGWLGLAYVAVAEKLWPMFLLAHRPHVSDGERAVWLVGIGAPVASLGLLWPSPAVLVIGGALVVAGLCFHLASLYSVIRHRRRGLELLHGFVLSSAACLVVAMVVGVIAGLTSIGTSTSVDTAMRSRLVTAEVACLILWLALAVIGHSHKIVPFISWNRLRDHGIMNGRDGRPLLFAHLVNPPAARITFALGVLGALTGVIGTLTATAELVRVGGAALGLAGVTAIANLVSGPLLMVRWHDRQRSAARPHEPVLPS